MSLVVSGGVLMGTAYAGANQLSGYEAYKLAIKDTANVRNETADVTVSVKDNGVSLVDVNSNIKVNGTSNAMSQATTVKSSNGSQSFNSFVQNGKSISKFSTSDVYSVRENKDE